MAKKNIRELYDEKRQSQQHICSEIKSHLHKISLFRLAAFLSEIGMIALMIRFGFSWLTVAPTAIPLLVFLFLVRKQVRLERELDYATRLMTVYQNEMNILDHGPSLYSDGEQFKDESHQYSSDLDIVGKGSLFAFINRCNTALGQQFLAESFLQGNVKEKILARQSAIRELTTNIEDTFHFRAQLLHHDPGQFDVLKRKLKQTSAEQLKFTDGRFVKLYISACPVLMLAVFAASVFWGGLLWSIFALLALFNWALVSLYAKRINIVNEEYSGTSRLLNALSETLKWQERIEWKSEYLAKSPGDSASDKPASSQILELSLIIRSFDARLNDIVGTFLNIFLVWDLKCCVQLGKWHRASSKDLVLELERISRFEELISFATLHHNQPDWQYPEISDTFGLSAEALAHPLIPAQHIVANDFSFAQHPTADIITGSNMAGKSTFLRTVGINLVLAYAGAPVYAKSFTASVFNLVSYMRIKDSLNDQISTFKAELNRLKMMITLAHSVPNTLVLIDEMLRGTNSRDKYLGSKAFIEKLVEQGIPVLFATHDLQLSEMQTVFTRQVRNYHFDIHISEGEMKFDYVLRSGPCKTFNASLLLEHIGLKLN